MRGSTVLNAHTGKAFEHASAFMAGLARVHAKGTSATAIQLATIAANGRRFDSMFTDLGVNRNDAAAYMLAADKVTRQDSASDGFYLARQLEHVHAEIMRTPRPVLRSFDLFHQDTSVPAGARTHTVRRISDAGEAIVYRGRDPLPRSGLTQAEEEFPVRHLVSSYGFDVFEQQSEQFARTNVIMEKGITCRDVIMRLDDELTWHGSEEHGLYGVLNYPWLAKRVSAVVFSMSTSAEDMLNELKAVSRFPAEASKGTFSPDTMVISEQLDGIISTKRLGLSADGLTETVKSFFLKTNSFIKNIEVAWKMHECGPGGTDGILVYRRDRYGISKVMVQAPSALPVQQMGFESVIPMYASTGGVIMREAGHNALSFVEVNV